jgi:CheY-like chemotaxis protein
MNAQTPYLLVVEDIPDILQLLEAALRFRGHRVVTARNGFEALEAIERERPVMVITDILMPRLDGFSLVHRLRIDPETRDLPVVFITATYIQAEDREFAMSIGVTRFVEKPVDIEQFLTMVDELLARDSTTIRVPLDDFKFYDGYRKRLEAKLSQKSGQIARTEQLLETPASDDEPLLRGSLSRAVNEQEEIKHLLAQVYKQLEKIDKPE